MERVLVVCGAGASSTFLALWMRRVARERGLGLSIEASSSDDVVSRLAGVDIILVGHHLATTFTDLQGIAADAGVMTALLPPLPFDARGAATALAVVQGLRSDVPSAGTVHSTEEVRRNG